MSEVDAKVITRLGDFIDHPRKQLFRRNWAKPLLAQINKNLNKKLIYLGLPGLEALDVKEWISYLDRVIAFECKVTEKNQSSFTSLNKLLNEFEIKQKLSSYSLYKGFLEKIVTSGVDENGQLFQQTDFVTVYNLDFCNSLTSPYKVKDIYGNVYKYYKLDAINKLLQYQEKNVLPAATSKFIMFLTVNSQFWEDELFDMKASYLKLYAKRLTKIKEEHRNVRLLKGYLHYHLERFFASHGFNVEFLPPIYYKGKGGFRNKKGVFKSFWFLTFTLLGTRLGPIPKTFSSIQDPLTFLKKKLIFANDISFSCFNDEKLDEDSFEPDPLRLLSESYTFANLWQ